MPHFSIIRDTLFAAKSSSMVWTSNKKGSDVSMGSRSMISLPAYRTNMKPSKEMTDTDTMYIVSRLLRRSGTCHNVVYGVSTHTEESHRPPLEDGISARACQTLNVQDINRHIYPGISQRLYRGPDPWRNLNLLRIRRHTNMWS